MKKFTKLFLSCAAVAGLATAMCVSASAMTATYDAGTLTLADVTDPGDQMTVVVLTEDATTVTDSMILGIDQAEEITTLKLDASKIDTENNTYYVRVGGSDGSIQTATFGKAASDRIWGDVDNSGNIRTADALQITYLCAEMSTTSDFTDADTKAAADTNDDGKIRTADALEITYFAAEMPTQYIDGTKTIAEKTTTVE